MNNTQKLLLRVMDRVPRNSKDGLAKAIGANRSNVRQYLKGERYPNATHAIKIAEILGMDVQEVIFYIQEDKTKNPEQKELLKRKLPRLHSTVATTLALLVGSFIEGNWDAKASEIKGLQEPVFCAPSYTLCEVMKRGTAQLFAQVKRFFETLLPAAGYQISPATAAIV